MLDIPLIRDSRVNINRTSLKAPEFIDDTVYQSRLKNAINNCAYCGAHVYTNNEINELSEIILSSKGKLLIDIFNDLSSNIERQSKITPTDKLIKRKNFFNDLIQLVIKNPDAKGKEILEQFKTNYQSNSEYYQEFLNKINHDPKSALNYAIYPLISTIDHFVARSNAGSNNYTNYVISCMSCNNSKGNANFNQWAQDKPNVINNLVTFFKQLIDCTSGNISMNETGKEIDETKLILNA